MEFRVLGPVAVLDQDGSEITLGGPKERAVLALLLLGAGQVVDTDRLVEELWPENRPEAGRKTVQAYVSRLRSRFIAAGEDEIIEGRPTGYVIDQANHYLDSEKFESLLASFGDLSAIEPAEKAASMKGALDLWRGRPFEDAHPTPELELEVQRLEELRLAGSEAWAEAELMAGHHRMLIPELHSLVSEHPLREHAWGLLMLALYRSGRQSEALRAYSTVSRHLREELGVEPSRELADLEHRMLVHDPTLEGPKRSGSSSGSRSGLIHWKSVPVIGLLLFALLSVLVTRLFSSSGRDPVTELQVEARYPLPDGGSEAVAAGGKVWILNPDRPAVTVFDPALESFTQYDLPVNPSTLASGLGYVWLVSARAGTIMKVDATTGVVVSELAGYDLDSAALAVGDGALWIIREHSSPFLRVDPSTLEAETIQYFQPAGSVNQPDLDLQDGVLWASNAYLGRIMSLDPESGSIQLAGDPRVSEHAARSVVTDRGAVWMSQPTNGSVTRIDSKTGAVTATASVGQVSGSGFGRVVPAYGLAPGPGGIWVAMPRDGKVVLLDDETAAIRGELQFRRPTAVAATVGTVWVLDEGARQLVKLSPVSCTPIPFIGPGADLRGCDLSGKALAGVDLTGADLRWSDLRFDLMESADLTNADLMGADLTSASVDGVTWAATRCPDGTMSSDNDGSCSQHLHP